MSYTALLLKKHLPCCVSGGTTRAPIKSSTPGPTSLLRSRSILLRRSSFFVFLFGLFGSIPLLERRKRTERLRRRPRPNPLLLKSTGPGLEAWDLYARTQFLSSDFKNGGCSVVPEDSDLLDKSFNRVLKQEKGNVTLYSRQPFVIKRSFRGTSNCTVDNALQMSNLNSV